MQWLRLDQHRQIEGRRIIGCVFGGFGKRYQQYEHVLPSQTVSTAYLPKTHDALLDGPPASDA